MESHGAAKRGASPSCLTDHRSSECASNATSTKRCRQLLPGHHNVWSSRSSAKAQSRPALRRAQSVPVAAETLEQQTCSDLEHWRSREVTHRPCPDQIDTVQREVTPLMRTMLVDWLGEVRDEFRLHTETLFLAVAYLDRFLTTRPVARGRFQLLGLACLWVAAKYEEVYPPPLAAMLAMAENMYSADDMRAMEKEVLFTLDFGLSVPTALRFLHYLLQLAPLPAHPGAALSARRLAEALLELTLLDRAFLRALPSQVASGAVYLSLGLLRHHEGLHGVVRLSGADPHALGVLVKRLSQVLEDAVNQPQPCAMLFRYKAWEGLHHKRGAAAQAAQAAPAAAGPPPPTAPAPQTAPGASGREASAAAVASPQAPGADATTRSDPHEAHRCVGLGTAAPGRPHQEEPEENSGGVRDVPHSPVVRRRHYHRDQSTTLVAGAANAAVTVSVATAAAAAVNNIPGGAAPGLFSSLQSPSPDSWASTTSGSEAGCDAFSSPSESTAADVSPSVAVAAAAATVAVAGDLSADPGGAAGGGETRGSVVPPGGCVLNLSALSSLTIAAAAACCC